MNQARLSEPALLWSTSLKSQRLHNVSKHKHELLSCTHVLGKCAQLHHMKLQTEEGIRNMSPVFGVVSSDCTYTISMLANLMGYTIPETKAFLRTLRLHSFNGMVSGYAVNIALQQINLQQNLGNDEPEEEEEFENDNEEQVRREGSKKESPEEWVRKNVAMKMLDRGKSTVDQLAIDGEIRREYRAGSNKPGAPLWPYFEIKSINDYLKRRGN